jgi:hypothetical protein
MSLYGYKKKYGKALWVGNSSQKPRAKIRRVSKARAISKAIYRQQAKIFIADCQAKGITCPVRENLHRLSDEQLQTFFAEGGSAQVTEVHHRFGRVGRLLLWIPGWLAVSSGGHAVIHQWPAFARKMGWLAPEGAWNDYARAQKNIE